MDISEIKKIVDQVFSNDGFKFLNFFFICPPSVDIKLNKDEEGINIDFTKHMPYVKTRRMLIPLSVYVEGLFLGPESGSIKLKYFPDLHFDYKGFSDERFGSNEKITSLESFNNQINKQYPDQERRKIAKIALQYANEWATIVSQAGVNVKDCGQLDRKKLKQDCEKFVLENIKNSKEIEAKSAILSFILIHFVLPAVISWVVKKFLDNFFN
jgi:hypothetical protein